MGRSFFRRTEIPRVPVGPAPVSFIAVGRPARDSVKLFHGPGGHETILGGGEAIFPVLRRHAEAEPCYCNGGIKQGNLS